MPDANQETGPDDVSLDSVFFGSAQTTTDDKDAEVEALSVENDDSEETPDTADTESDETLFTVNPDGEEMQVTEDELKSGYMKTQAFKRKTTEAAQQVKAAKDLQAQFAQKIDAIEAMMTEEVDWFETDEAKELKLDDPNEYWSRYEQTKKRVDKFKGFQKDKSELKLSDSELQEQHDLLLAKIPQWTDAKKMKEEGQLALNAAADIGWTNEELAKLTDHKIMVALREAAMYRKIMSAKPSKKEVKPSTKTAKSSNKAKPPEEKTMAEIFYG